MIDWWNDGNIECSMNGIAILRSDWIKYWWNDGIVEQGKEGIILKNKLWNDVWYNQIMIRRIKWVNDVKME